jgi:hypothetical protein
MSGTEPCAAGSGQVLAKPFTAHHFIQLVSALFPDRATSRRLEASAKYRESKYP